jgi:hypothetical protein
VRVSGNTTVSRLTQSSSAIECANAREYRKRGLFLSSGCEKQEIPAALAASAVKCCEPLRRYGIAFTHNAIAKPGFIAQQRLACASMAT